MRFLIVLLLTLTFAAPHTVSASEIKKQGWQCATYARQIAPVKLFGAAWTWWQQAVGKYQRGNSPKLGSVLVFQKSPFMHSGHVAVVRQQVSEREILVEHANWAASGTAGRGKIETDAKVIDVSPNNDWTEVRVWYSPAHAFGRTNASYGFVYAPNLDPKTGITWDDTVNGDSDANDNG